MKASVIIPAYNAEKVIVECLGALKRQTKRPLEVIVVDDGSKDRTGDAAKRLGAKVIRQKNAGPAAARNRGAKAAKGDILLFTDADCVPDKSWVEEMLRPLNKKDVAGVQGAYRTKQKSVVARFSQAEIEDRYRKIIKHDYIDFIGTYAAGYKKQIFDKFGGFDESFPKASGEDPELSFRMANKGHKLVFNRDAIVYHTHPNSITKYLKQKYWRAYWRVLLYKKHPKKAIKDTYTPQSLKFMIMLTYFTLLLLATFPVLGLISTAVLLVAAMKSAENFRHAEIKDMSVIAAAPFIIIMRSFVFGLGLVAGTIKNIV